MCKGLNIRIPNIFPMKGRGFINQGSGFPEKLLQPVSSACRLAAACHSKRRVPALLLLPVASLFSELSRIVVLCYWGLQQSYERHNTFEATETVLAESIR